MDIQPGHTRLDEAVKLYTTSYLDQLAGWPKTGRQVLGQFDVDSVVVYQAYNPAIGHYAVQHGHFGGEFSLNRMSWIKPNFLWMMYRSGWGTKVNQEVVLAIWLKRTAFDEILEQAVYSSYVPAIYHTEEAWKEAITKSDVRLQWDPDHDPSGRKVERRAIQLGLRGEALAKYAREWILCIEDISDFVRQQHLHCVENFSELTTPIETDFSVVNATVITKLQLTSREKS